MANIYKTLRKFACRLGIWWYSGITAYVLGVITVCWKNKLCYLARLTLLFMNEIISGTQLLSNAVYGEKSRSVWHKIFEVEYLWYYLLNFCIHLKCSIILKNRKFLGARRREKEDQSKLRGKWELQGRRETLEVRDVLREPGWDLRLSFRPHGRSRGTWACLAHLIDSSLSGNLS